MPGVVTDFKITFEALEHNLRDERTFLRRFNLVDQAVNNAVDMNNNDLVLLVRACLQNAGKLSANRAKQLIAKGHPAELIEEAQRVVTAVLEALNDAG